MSHICHVVHFRKVSCAADAVGGEDASQGGMGCVSMPMGHVWVGLLRLIHLHVHSAIPPHIPCDADRRTQLPNAPAEPEPISDIALPVIRTGPDPRFKTH